jgi:hypothetical protein
VTLAMRAPEVLVLRSKDKRRRRQRWQSGSIRKINLRLSIAERTDDTLAWRLGVW